MGWHVRSQLDYIMATLVNMLAEPKVVVRHSVVRVINKLMNVLTPGPVLEHLVRSLQHRNWRVREEVINCIILSLSLFPEDQLDMERLASKLASSLTDVKSRVKYVAVEAFAVMSNKIGADKVVAWLDKLDVKGKSRTALDVRLREVSSLPAVSSDGVVRILVFACMHALLPFIPQKLKPTLASDVWAR